MTKEKLLNFMSKQKTAFLASVNGEGFPVIRAMLAPRIIEGNSMYFSTNTSSEKVKQFLQNDKACVYFYKRGAFKYQGAYVTGVIRVREDEEAKKRVWRLGDALFYKEGVNDPDYCVLQFTGESAEYYCDFKIEKIDF